MTNRKHFGTDGIRGTVGQHPITAEFMLKLGWAVGRVLGTEGSNIFIIGKDTRVSGYMFESALEAGLAAAGADIVLLGPMPTPAIAYLTKTSQARAGIVISASHNPSCDNGIKFFSANGEKLLDAEEKEIEQLLSAEMVTVANELLGKATRMDDAAGRYVEFCKSRVDTSFSLAGVKCVLDCANGAAYHVGPMVFRELGADLTLLGCQPDGFNINRGCGSTSPEALQREVVQQGADFGIGLDGDADRVLMVDSKGNLIDGDQILYVLARGRQAAGQMMGGVVGTVMTNAGLALAFAQLGLPFERSAVGDRYVHKMLSNRGWVLGGETSGHILCLDKTSTGDGLITALLVLQVLQQMDRPLADLAHGFEKFPQVMLNVPIESGRDQTESPAVAQLIESAAQRLGSYGRLFVRKSGTEPVVRVTAEGQDESQVRLIAEEMAALVRG